jgi:hypothetical protein
VDARGVVGMKFTARDFDLGDLGSNQDAAAVANKKLKAWLDEAPTVNGYQENNKTWVLGSDKDSNMDTHTAKLVDIQAIEKPKCEHATIRTIKQILDNDEQEIRCAYCRKKLKVNLVEVSE